MRVRGAVSGGLAAALVGVVVLGLPALASAADVYRSPGYRGTTKVPQTTAPPNPPPVTIGTGRSPQVLVDAAGTAHVTWSEERGDDADAVRYCRLKRGAPGCDVTRELVPVQVGELAAPIYNDEYGVPRVLAIGDELVVLTARYPNLIAGPDGELHDRNTYLFASDDGGGAFQAETLVGTGPTSGQPSVFGPPDTPRIGLISDTVTGGTFFQAISGARYNARTANLGADGIDASLAPDGAGLVAAFAQLDGRIHVRAWNGAGDPEDPAAWSDVTLPGTDPRLAGGPGGVFLLSRDVDHLLGVRRVDGGAIGPRTVLQGTRNASMRDVFQDASGRLFVTYRQSTADGPVLRVRSATDGRTFSAAQTLLRAPSDTGLWSSDLAAAGDGGGFAIVHQAPDGRASPIVAQPFGNQSPTGQPGLGGQPGGGLDPDVISTCQRLAFGDVSIRTTEGCLLPTAKSKAIKVAEGTLRLNGLELVPEGGAKIVLDARARTLDTSGTIRVQLRAPGIDPVVLFRGELHIRLAAEQRAQARAAAVGTCAGQRLADFAADTDLKGFPIRGSIAVYLAGESSCVPVSLELPKAFGGVRGDALLRADNARGLHVDSLHVGVDQALIGPVLLQGLAIDYQAAGDEWRGKATVGLPPQPGGAKLGAAVRFAGGAFREGRLELKLFYPGIALDPFAVSYLNRVSGGFGIDPLFVEVGAGIGVLPVPPSAYTFQVDGNLRVTFADPVTFDFTGTGRFFDFPVADQRLLVTTDGLAKANGRVGIELGPVSVEGGLDAFVDLPSKRFGGKVAGEVCIAACVDAAAVVSTRGIGACTPIGGFGHRWKDPILDVEVMVFSCDLSDYTEDVPAGRAVAAQAGRRTFRVAAGQSVVNVRVTGAGAAPDVVLVAPSGERIVPAADPSAPGTRAAAVRVGTRTIVGVRDATPGTWAVEAVDGSAAIASVAVAHAVAAPKVTAHLGGRGRKRTLRYTVTAGRGMQTTFVERSRLGARAIGVARGRRGTLRFAPGPGPRGPRTIAAVVERAGVPRLDQTVATYVAPGPARPARVRGLRLARHGRTLTARWRAVRGARGYAVRVTLPGGRSLLRVVPPGQRRLAVGGVSRRGRATVTVAARDAAGRTGPAARGRR